MGRKITFRKILNKFIYLYKYTSAYVREKYEDISPFDPFDSPYNVEYNSFNQIKMDGNWALETASHCNRKCSFCPRNNGFEKFRRFRDNEAKDSLKIRMPLSKIVDILDQIKEISTHKSPLILPCVLNEPYEDERIVDILQEIKKRRFRVYMISNGDVLTKNPALFEKSFQFIDILKFGIYGNLSTKEGIEFYKNRKDFYESSLLKIKEKVSYAPAEIHFAGSFDDVYEAPDWFVTKGNSIHWPCYLNAHGYRVINVYGELSMCCKDYARANMPSTILGNVYETSLKELIFQKKHLDILNILRKGERNKFVRCSTCYISVGVRNPSRNIFEWRHHREGYRKTNIQAFLDKIIEKRKLQKDAISFPDFTIDNSMSSFVEKFNSDTKIWE